MYVSIVMHIFRSAEHVILLEILHGTIHKVVWFMVQCIHVKTLTWKRFLKIRPRMIIHVDIRAPRPPGEYHRCNRAVKPYEKSITGFCRRGNTWWPFQLLWVRVFSLTFMISPWLSETLTDMLLTTILKQASLKQRHETHPFRQLAELE